MTGTLLASLDEVKAFLEVRSGDSTHDAKITGLIDTASRQIEAFCNTLFSKSERIETFNTYDNALRRIDLYGDTIGSRDSGIVVQGSVRTFMLAAAPIDMDVNFDVRYDPIRGFGSETVLAANSDFVVEESTGKLRLVAIVGTTLRGLQVTYSGGYTVANGVAAAPADLKHACVVQTVYLWGRSLPENVGSTSDNTGKSPAQYARKDLLCDEALGLCQQYRRIRTGQT